MHEVCLCWGVVSRQVLAPDSFAQKAYIWENTVRYPLLGQLDIPLSFGPSGNLLIYALKNVDLFVGTSSSTHVGMFDPKIS